MAVLTLLTSCPGRCIGALLLSGMVASPAGAVEPKDDAWVIDVPTCTFPKYPAFAKREGHTGTTTLEFLIRTDGTIAATRVKQSSGHFELDRAAQESLSQCHFKLQVPVAPDDERWQLTNYVWTLDPVPPAKAIAR